MTRVKLADYSRKADLADQAGFRSGPVFLSVLTTRRLRTTKGWNGPFRTVLAENDTENGPFLSFSVPFSTERSLARLAYPSSLEKDPYHERLA